jgi:NTE family protein
MTYALVLGAGGVTGAAWETGLLRGLRDAGLDLTGADLVIGTSAGALVGAQVRSGLPLDRLYERQASGPAGGAERPPDLGPLLEFFAGRVAREGEAVARRRPTPEVLTWIGRQARSASTRCSEAARTELVRSLLPADDWPDRPLLLTAVDTGDGSLVTWERSSGVPLSLAVAASGAVPWVHPPVTIRGRRYMDGGMRSATNADLAAGHDLVLVLAPTGDAPACRGVLFEEVDVLRAGGGRVQVVVPDAAALEAIGPNPLDPARRAGAARAGLAQAPTVARLLAPIRDGLPV